MRVYLADLLYDQNDPISPVPLNAGYVAAYAIAEFDNLVDVTIFKSPAVLLDAIDRAPPDILGLSCFIWNDALNQFVAEYLKERSEGSLVVVGGPNFRTDPESIREFLIQNPNFDYCVLFGGEIPFANIIRHFIDENPMDLHRGANIGGCCTLSNEGDLIGQAYADPRKDLDYIPSPYLTGLLDPFLKAGHTPLFETNRGCPYLCTFCVWGIGALHKLRQFTIERVLAEIDYVGGLDLEMPEWRFADANFGILKRDAMIAWHVRRIYDRNPKSFPYVDIFWAKNPTKTMVDVAQAFGNLTMGYVAFQSFDDNVLESVKRSNISKDRLIEFIGEITPYVSDILTDLLAGLPSETFESNLSSYRNALRIGFTQINTLEVRMLPGSEMDTVEHRDKFGLKTKWRFGVGNVGYWRGKTVFELEEVIRSTSSMSEEEMCDLRVIQAILYGNLVLGYLPPLVSAIKAAHIDFVSIIVNLVRSKDAGPNLSALINQMIDMARAEHFDTEEAAHTFFAAPCNAKKLLEEPPVKFNFWFNASLIHNRTAGQEFGNYIESVLVKEGLSPKIASELVTLSRDTRILEAAIDGTACAKKSTHISDGTRQLLIESKWLPAGSTNDVVLEIEANLLSSIQIWVDERKPLTFADTAQFQGVFANRFKGGRSSATLEPADRTGVALCEDAKV